MTDKRITDTGYNQEDAYFHQKDLDMLAKRRAELDAPRGFHHRQDRVPAVRIGDGRGRRRTRQGGSLRRLRRRISRQGRAGNAYPF